MDFQRLQQNIAELARDFGAEAMDRTTRRSLDAADFDALRETGYWLSAVPAERGGLFQSIPGSTRPICDALRTLAHGDGCVALVAAMHPAVLIYWLAAEDAPAEFSDAWAAQRDAIFDGVENGDLWGTVTSEPGSGGDILKTRATAQRDSDGWLLSGDKHFGSGSGMSTFMLTTATASGEDLPDVFFVNIKDTPWDGSAGVELLAEWNAHGMMATQSHAFRFAEYPAQRVAWPGMVAEYGPHAGGFANCLFVAVILGVFDVAMTYAREKMRPRLESLRAFEQIEWTVAENDYWTACHVYQGMLNAAESGVSFPLDTVRAKMVVAELAESAMARIAKATGGGAFTRNSPLGQWAQDIRALGFLRPPWGLAFDQIHLGQIAKNETE